VRICYVLLSPTFGMHQYTADIANRMVRAGHDVHLVTTSRHPSDRYVSEVKVYTPVDTTNTGFSLQSLRLRSLRRAKTAICQLEPDVVHFTGPHLWNALLVRWLTARGIPVVHTLHDLDPHSGTRYGMALHIWNGLIIRSADHILIHGRTYQQRLLDMGLSPSRVTWTPLLHLFLGSMWLAPTADLARDVEYGQWALFFGRLERYKGIDCLLTACAMMDEERAPPTRVVLAGSGELADLWADPVPAWMELRSHLVEDEEAIELFRRCGLVVLPYIDATQSALIAAAYFFRKPVVVTHAGALPEYVEDGVTGAVLEPGHPAALARSLEEMLGDTERLAEMGNAGRAWYDARRVAEARTLFEMYSRLGRSDRMPEPTVKLSDRPI
jgi:glycosyltransferase involved in cell wall biosynthesis